MAKVIFHHTDGKNEEVTIRDGHTILRAAIQGRVSLRHKCGGRASCTTCRVQIPNQDGVSKPNLKEIQKLGQAGINENLRLSCQTKVYKSVDAHIPEDPYKARIRSLLKKQQEN
ncbi:2Fe-2S iron-sulfur cluster-binding protein [Cerasibacillus terrae]|nr:2Fe-2S iron-sulfur cluster-binding protein [Cerasibacillus terrae]